MKTLGDLLQESWMGESVDVEEWERCIERLRNQNSEWFVKLAEEWFEDAKQCAKNAQRR